MVGFTRCPAHHRNTWMAGQRKHIRSTGRNSCRERSIRLLHRPSRPWFLIAHTTRSQVLHILGWRTFSSEDSATFRLEEYIDHRSLFRRGIAFLYAALFPDDVKKYVSIDISSPCTKNTKKTIDFISGAVDKFLDYEKKSLEDLPSYEYKDMLKIMEDAYKGSVNTKGCEILLRRGMRKATNKEGYQFTRDPRLKLGLLGFVTMDQALEFASRIKCEVMNIKAKDGLIKKLDDPENYDIVFDYIGKNAKTLEMLSVEGTHHVHLNDADSIAPSIHKFLVS